MLFIATGLILVGGLLALYGSKLFRILLPIAGIVVGAMVGFGGVQAVFGTGVISFTIAVLMAVITAVIMGLLSFVFYSLAVKILVAMLGATAFSYLGIAVGLSDNGFILTLLGLAGAVIGLIYASRGILAVSLVFSATSFLGVAFILAGVFLFAGDISIDQLNDDGIIRSVVNTVDQSFLWFFVWIAGSIIMMNLQIRLAASDLLPDSFEYVESNNKRRA